MKEHLCFSPILSIYGQNKNVFNYTEASRNGIGAVLKQSQKNDLVLHPVAYFSKKLQVKIRNN